MSLLRRIEKSLDQRLRSIFSGGGDEPDAREAIELYRDALDQIARRATVGKRGDRVLPFNLITIELAAADAERKAVLETLFDAGQLGDDIRATLKEERVTPPGDLAVAVKYPEAPLVEMRVICERTEKPAASAPSTARAVEIVPARLVTVIGASPSREFTLDQPRINIGREAEILDSLGRTMRRNELYFPEAAHEANASVSRSHAHIRFESGGWRIFDDGSSIGTTLFRDGRRIDIPAHAGRGVALRAGDEIYLGQVRLRFETTAR
ncbi:MAG TPA: FHA domain-containing protein [Bryobacteraceae bacterium]|nr:FHA domain-containing protein [Bryobacteraceae bacterium]